MTNNPTPHAFITGASGLLGAYLSYNLLLEGYKLTALKRESSSLVWTQIIFDELNKSSGKQVDFKKIKWINGTVLEHNLLVQQLNSDTTVFHCAAKVSFYKPEFEEMNQTNIDGTATVVNACLEAGVEKLIFISSVAALANPEEKAELDESFQNTTFYRFKTHYGETKYRSEMEVWRAHGEGMKVLVFNPGVILGRWKFEGSSIQMFNSVAKGLPFYTEGSTGLIDVRDVCSSIINTMNSPNSWGKRYILVSSNISYKSFLHKIAHAFNQKAPSIKVGTTLSYIVSLFATAISKITGKKPFITPEIAKTANRGTFFINKRISNINQSPFIQIDETIEWIASFYQTAQAIDKKHE